MLCPPFPVFSQQPVGTAARGAVIWTLIATAEEEVLLEIFAKLFEDITQSTDDQIIAQDGMLLLRDVFDIETGQRQQHAYGVDSMLIMDFAREC